MINERKLAFPLGIVDRTRQFQTSCEWYVAAYWLFGSTGPESTQELGAMCILGEYDASDGTKIDEVLGPADHNGVRRPMLIDVKYRRITTTITFLD
jgi:hypothetical protein